MKKLMRDALIFVGGFAAGVATMHFLMRDTYKKQADVLVEDARNHFKQREQELVLKSVAIQEMHHRAAVERKGVRSRERPVSSGGRF